MFCRRLVASWALVLEPLLRTSAGVHAAALSAILSPAQPYVERTATGVAVNGDIIVENSSNETYELKRIGLDVRDARGRLIQRKELSGNGTSPSIFTVPERSVAPHSRLIIYNPFYAFPSSLDFDRLDFTLELKGKAGGDEAMLQVSGRVRKSGATLFRLPVRGRVFVWDGHDFYSHHRRWNYLVPSLQAAGYRGNAGRYAYDFIIIGADGRERSGPESDNRSWFSFGRPVVAATSGTVVDSRGDAPDDRTFHRSNDPNAIFGNRVVLRESDGSFSLYGHLKHGSVAVKIGDQVRAGQFIGRIGASGDSLFPHLHFQHADSPDDLGEGIPVSWTRAHRLVGNISSPLINGSIDTGDIVASD